MLTSSSVLPPRNAPRPGLLEEHSDSLRPVRADLSCQALELRNELIVPSEDDWKAAWADYEQGKVGQAGIVDHVSFVVMRRLGVTEAFTNDRHFQAAGFTVLF